MDRFLLWGLAALRYEANTKFTLFAPEIFISLQLLLPLVVCGIYFPSGLLSSGCLAPSHNIF
jgi:hypothetical protein